MRHSSLLSGTFSVALLAACSTGGQPPTSAVVSPAYPIQTSTPPTPTPVSNPSPIASPSPSPLTLPSPRTPFFRCDTPDLEMRLIFVGAGLGNVGDLIEVRNKSSRDCDLYGYAGLQLLDARGRPVPTSVSWSNSSYLFGPNQLESVIGLPAGTAQITPDHPVPGHAYSPISWNDVQEPCSSAAQLKVTPPDASSSLVISTIAPGAAAGLMSFCSGGEVIVNPTRAAFYR